MSVGSGHYSFENSLIVLNENITSFNHARFNGNKTNWRISRDNGENDTKCFERLY